MKTTILTGALLILNTLMTTPVAAAGARITEIQENYLDLADGGRLYYRDSGGTGTAVVFMHAGSGNSSVWEPQLAPFGAAGYRFIAFDRPGSGRSTRGTQTGSDKRAELDQLMDKLGIQRFHLVGVAAGGGAALQYVIGHEERVRSLVIANSIGNVQDAAYNQMGQRLRPAAFNQLPLEVRELGPSYRAVNPQGVQRWLELSTLGKGTESPAPAPPGTGPAANGPPAGGPPAGGPPGGGTAVTWEALGKLGVPTLLTTGDADLYTPPSVLRLFKQHMPRAELVIIPESGHASYWENPDAFNSAVLKFIAQH
ncbi:MAG: alpha/beta hydrolase [Steroidobacteraceae bacterium]